MVVEDLLFHLMLFYLFCIILVIYQHVARHSILWHDDVVTLLDRLRHSTWRIFA